MHDGVSLRDVIESDLPIFFQQQLDPDANRMAAFIAREPADRAAFMRHWSRILRDDTVTIKTVLHNGQVAGHILSFVHGDSGNREVGYWLGKEYWGKGIATRALSAFLEQYPVRPLHAVAAADNIASIRVLENCGFTPYGEDREHSRARHEEVNQILFTLA
jgi:RimJ/RimL family protein N-acetyltransferase